MRHRFFRVILLVIACTVLSRAGVLAQGPTDGVRQQAATVAPDVDHGHGLVRIRGGNTLDFEFHNAGDF